jgi:hypothetical protein
MSGSACEGTSSGESTFGGSTEAFGCAVVFESAVVFLRLAMANSRVAFTNR